MPEEEDGWQSVPPMDSGDEDEEENEQQSWGDDAAESPDDEMDTIPTLDPKWRNAFQGLSYIGYLEDSVQIPYHEFKVRTLKTGEKIEVTSLVQILEQSVGYHRAYRAAVAAAGLMLVDGKPLLVGSKREGVIEQRYRYIIDNWHDYVIDLLYDKINSLEGQVLEIMKELGIYDSRHEVVQVPQSEATGPVVRE